MKNIKETILKFDELDMDNIEVVQKLGKKYTEWLRWNKTYEDIDVLECQSFRTIVVVHNLFESELKTYDSWEFLEDVKYLLEEYVNHEQEDEELHDLYFDDVYGFWNSWLDGIIEELC